MQLCGFVAQQLARWIYNQKAFQFNSRPVHCQITSGFYPYIWWAQLAPSEK